MAGLVNATALVAVLVGEPAPRTIGPAETVMIGAASVALLVAAAWVVGGGWRTAAVRPGLFLPVLFALPLIQSTVIAWVRGVQGESVFRSVAPYLVFLPLSILGLVDRSGNRSRRVARVLVIAGLLQAAFLLALYLTTGGRLSDADAVRYARITLLDPRTTSPLVLASAILPWAWWPAMRSVWGRAAIIGVSGLGAIAAATTQTRSMILATVLGVGLAVGGALGLGRQVEPGGRNRRVVLGLLAAALLMAALALWAPPVNALLRAIAARSQIDRDTGRIDDEWTPAIATLLDGGVGTVVMGVGSGESYVTAGGEERTYVHNLVIYALLYFGIVGLAVLLFGYLLLGGLLARRSVRSRDPTDWALAALLAAMFLYAQFFAVHKLLSYNLMLMLILQALASSNRAATDGAAR